MAKRFCKMNRKQIAENLGDIHRLVVEPKFLCRSCARSSADKESLCKPAAIPPQACQNQPLEQQQSCALLAEALPPVTANRELKSSTQRVVQLAKQKVAQRQVQARENSLPASISPTSELADDKALKKAKKALKKHYKQQKKLLKLAKKQYKLSKKNKKLEAKLNLANLAIESNSTQNNASLH